MSIGSPLKGTEFFIITSFIIAIYSARSIVSIIRRCHIILVLLFYYYIICSLEHFVLPLKFASLLATVRETFLAHAIQE